jgi:putative colanic acid biosynthesis UDP-glucose lipid carrier transferase
MIRNSSHTGLLRPFSTEFTAVNRVLDAVIIWGNLHLICGIYPISNKDLYQYAAFLAIISYFFAAEIHSIYRSSRLQPLEGIFSKIFTAWMSVCLILIFLAFITKTSTDFSRFVIGLWLFFTPVLLALERIFIYLALRYLRAHGSNTRTYAILGDVEASVLLEQKIAKTPWMGLTHKGTYNQLALLTKDLKANHIDYVFLCYSEGEQNKIVQAIGALSDSTASVYLTPSPFLTNLMESNWITVGNMSLIAINDHPFYGFSWLSKKIEDYILGLVFLIISLPAMMLIAMTIKFTSSGSILFKQRRYGLNGEVIQVWKFRTMTTQDDGAVVQQAQKDDSRVTPLGKFLRKTSLDELPQFINVLQGKMSIVGPRPHAVSHNEQYRKLIGGYMLRHKVKPGITGWAQINGLRGETETIEKMQARIDYDLYYINHWSIWLDLKIIFMTIVNGFTGKSAY